MNSVNGKTRNECFKTTTYSPTPAFGLPRIFHAILPIRYKIETSTQGGPLAQRLEQRTHNPLVPGSNPGGPTKTATRVHQLWAAPSRHCRFDLRGESAFVPCGIYAGHNVVISFAAVHCRVGIPWFWHSGSDLRILAA